MTFAPLFKHHWQVRFVDTDASGFAHFSSYVKMMEETEYAFLRSRGLSVVLHDERGTIGFPRIAAEIDVQQPLRFEDRATIQLHSAKIDGKQITYEFTFESTESQRVAEGRFVVACCRFPNDRPPYAILIPAAVEIALTTPHVVWP